MSLVWTVLGNFAAVTTVWLSLIAALVIVVGLAVLVGYWLGRRARTVKGQASVRPIDFEQSRTVAFHPDVLATVPIPGPREASP